MLLKPLVIAALILPLSSFSEGLAPPLNSERSVHSKSEKMPSSRRSWKSNRSKNNSWRAEASKKRSQTQPACQGEDSFFAEAGFVYLYAKQSDLYVGESVNGSVQSPIQSNFNWSPGFRVGLGFRDVALDWTASVSWTNLSTNPRTSVVGTIAPLETTATYTSVYQAWKLNYDQFELLMKGPTRRYLNFSFNFGVGVEGAYLRQKRSLSYEGALSSTLSIKDKNRFIGVGPLLRFLGRFDLGRSFGFTGDLSASVLWGDFQCTRDVTGDDSLSTTNNSNQVTWSLKSQAGFDWVGSGGCLGMRLFLGWQMRAYYDQWHVHAQKNALLNTTGGNVNLSGFVFSTEVCF
jgi:hypothetical protein